MRKKFSCIASLIVVCVALAGASIGQTPRRTRAFQVTTRDLPVPVARQRYEFQLAAVGGTPPYHWSIPAASLPAGLSLNEWTGLISGRPQSSDEYSVLISVSDSSDPPLTVTKLLVASSSAPLTVRWTVSPHTTESNLSGAVRVANGSKDTVDMTVIVVAVNEIGKAFALRYEHLQLPAGEETPDLKFDSSLPMGRYTAHVDAVAEVPAKKAIYRDRREVDGLVVASQ